MNLEEILGKYKKHLAYENEKKAFERIMSSYDDPDLAKDIASYITIALNEQSVRGFINYQEFVEIFKTLVDGLYRRIMIYHLKDDYLENWASYYSKRWSEFLTAYVYIYISLTRILGGKEYNIILEEIRAKQPITIARAMH